MEEGPHHIVYEEGKHESISRLDDGRNILFDFPQYQNYKNIINNWRGNSYLIIW